MAFNFTQFGHELQQTYLVRPLVFIPSFSIQFQEQGRAEAEPEPKDKVQSLKDQVDGVKNIMTQNVDRILARGERLDDLMDKSEDLQAGVSLVLSLYVKVGWNVDYSPIFGTPNASLVYRAFVNKEVDNHQVIQYNMSAEAIAY